MHTIAWYFCKNEQLLAPVIHDSLFFYDFATKSIKNMKNLKFPADPPHKMWE